MCVVANVVMMTTTSIGGLYAGRFVIGLANGLFMTFAQLYLQVRYSPLPSKIGI
jgi:SP family sugar:H+ symporter-like MFS transporter